MFFHTEYIDFQRPFGRTLSTENIKEYTDNNMLLITIPVKILWSENFHLCYSIKIRSIKHLVRFKYS